MLQWNLNNIMKGQGQAKSGAHGLLAKSIHCNEVLFILLRSLLYRGSLYQDSTVMALKLMRAVRKETSKPDLKVFPVISDNPLSYHSSED